MKKLACLIAVGAFTIGCAPRRHVVVGHDTGRRVVHIHDSPRYRSTPPSVVHVHGPSCRHEVVEHAHDESPRRVETHDEVGSDHQGTVYDYPRHELRKPERTKCHVHHEGCGHVLVDGKWLPPGHAKRHVHGDGCGHVYADGEWLPPGQAKKVKKEKREKEEKKKKD